MDSFKKNQINAVSSITKHFDNVIFKLSEENDLLSEIIKTNQTSKKNSIKNYHP